MIRLATPDDMPALFAVRTSVTENHLDLAQLAERGVTPESIAEMTAAGSLRTWVAEEGGEVCGFSMADTRTGSIFAVFVLPAAEGKGHGRALLSAAEDWLFASGWPTIWLDTAEDPTNRAHAFYRAAGWTLVRPSDHGDVRYEKSRRA